MSAAGCSITTSEPNAIYEAFWMRQEELMNRGLADPTLQQALRAELQGYELRGVIARHQESVEAILEKYDRIRQSTLKEQASRAGRKPKADALQNYIVALVRKRPRITECQLFARLEQDQYGELIQDIDDGVIYFTQPDGSEDRRTKKASIGGLKDRLSRAKKKINSR